jgi:ribosomal protein S27AE
MLKEAFHKVQTSVTPDSRDIRSQRMCPFCGLITPRHKAICLECGKSFKPA